MMIEWEMMEITLDNSEGRRRNTCIAQRCSRLGKGLLRVLGNEMGNFIRFVDKQGKSK